MVQLLLLTLAVQVIQVHLAALEIQGYQILLCRLSLQGILPYREDQAIRDLRVILAGRGVPAIPGTRHFLQVQAGRVDLAIQGVQAGHR